MANIARCTLESSDKTNLSRYFSTDRWEQEQINKRRVKYVLQQTKSVRLAKERKGVVIRFTFDEQRTRMAHNGDPVVSTNGERIGFVTSCAIDSARFITGQAYVDLAYTKMDTPIFIHQGAVLRQAQDVERPPAGAKVVSRFAKL